MHKNKLTFIEYYVSNTVFFSASLIYSLFHLIVSFAYEADTIIIFLLKAEESRHKLSNLPKVTEPVLLSRGCHST